MPPKGKYTDPELRDEVKEELHNSDKGGAPGQWSARKAQMMASEYKKRGGGYTTDKKDDSQKHLENWGEEDWQTKDGEGTAKQDDGSRKRYLPKKAWEDMSEAEKKKTDQKKQSGSKQGKQYVENTDKAKASRKKAAKDDREDEEEADSGGQDEDFQPEEEDGDEGEDEDEHDSANDDQENQEPKTKTGQKRGRGKADDSPSKKQKSRSGQSTKNDDNNEETEEDSKSKLKPKENSKSKNKDNKSPEGKATIGSKHMDATEPAQKGSADRLPKKDQKVQWRAMPGYVSGKLVEVLKSDKTIDGKSHKASAKDPKLVLESDSSGKICVHKPETCFYD